jgi:2-C-methyl-D-erythritol 4-phosphate cytidylyltransferase/2-C-methyl-D-erythritol 2,4-cyclodiphosphate synthase
MSTFALIVAAGRGERLGADRPKQYLPLAGVPILARTVAAFAGHPRVDGVQVVIRPGDEDLYEDALRGFDLPPPVRGGATRQESVRHGLDALKARTPSRVLIHDAARPFISAAAITRVIDALDFQPGAIAAVPLADTLKRGADGRITGTVDRSGLWRAQTPQGFHFDAILAAHHAAAGRGDLTDDAAVAELAGLDVALVPGDEGNMKITTADDLARAEHILLAGLSDLRVGTGYDVHRLVAGDGVWLCGVKIASDRKLDGHSDADVALHAIVDAILGALGEGDIGQHFPPSDAKWKGAPSRLFVEHAASLVRARGGAIAHVDVTIVCERPKVSPHRAAMRSALAAMLGVAEDRISVKATTTEGLGLTGRGEGIAAQAVATIRLPGAAL